ncbi:MAG: trypsin-like peptidase domain-containing protein [Gemmataceae bacterium]|nr:trypsin-like peptidase domain-containing protein [Gemmataceae bacterium]MCI0739225.1 trypsin-like peptidase domain-containing protein [Gemmataceae bacterium]
MWSVPFRAIALSISVLVLSTTCRVGSAHAGAPHDRRTPIVKVVEKTKPSIVTVKAPRWGGKGLSATGVIVDERGFIVTSRHVVGKGQGVRVLLHDQTELPAETVCIEASTDLAILRVRAGKKLPALPPAPVADLLVGETVVAVGHPYGYTNTVSVGIISALRREITMPSGDKLTELIQTDASINPGNSGGPLLNINGELIGINVAVREGARGIAFAVNAGTVKDLLAEHLGAAEIGGKPKAAISQEKSVVLINPFLRFVRLDSDGAGRVRAALWIPPFAE